MSSLGAARDMVLASLIIAWCYPTAAADHWNPDQNKCNEQPSTLAIVDCIDGRTKLWEGRLNQAYRALTSMFQDPDLKSLLAPLRVAQREWLKYREANCIGYYGPARGTISTD